MNQTEDLSLLTRDQLIQRLSASQNEVTAMKRELHLISLRRQVTPHFLFNSISVAMSLVMQSPDKAVTFLRLLARMYRYLLTYGNKYHVPIEQELEMMQQFYELMSIRHVDCIHLTIAPEVKRLKKHPLPPLALQGLLENAIKHNSHTKEQPLEVSMYVEDCCLCMSNKIVPLISEANTTKIGLAYMNETMQLLFDRNIEIINDGESFCVKLPLITEVIGS